jgi:hypothetical protein
MRNGVCSLIMVLALGCDHGEPNEPLPDELEHRGGVGAPFVTRVQPAALLDSPPALPTAVVE